MRIGGIVLLVVGCLLSLTIVWAAIGFIMMGFGLVCLLIAEREKKDVLHVEAGRRKKASRDRSPAAAVASPESMVARDHASRSLVVGEIGRRPVAEAAPSPEYPVRPSVSANAGRDLESWRQLLDADRDLARAVQHVLPFGTKYADHLMRAYLVSNDRSHLPVIVSLVAETIRKETGLEVDDSALVETVSAEVTSFVPDPLADATEDETMAAPMPGDTPADVDQVSEADRSEMEETENLMDLLNRMIETPPSTRR